MIWAVLVISACKSNEEKQSLPIPRPKMVAILADLYMANSAVDLHPSANKDSLQQIYLTEICKIHEITPEKMAECQKVLNMNLKLNADIQKEVLDSVNLITTKKMTQN